MILKISLLILWIASALLEGRRDGFFFHNWTSSNDPSKENIHWLFTLERSIILILIAGVYCIFNSILNTSVFILSLILIFSFFHNGQYYLTRNNLNNRFYPKRWFDSSTTSESFLEFNVTARIFLALIGIIGMIVSFTFK